MINDNLLTYIANHTASDGELLELLQGAFSSRGKTKGYLLNNKPKDTDKQPNRSTVWLALIGVVCPVRAQVWSVMFMRDKERAIYDKVEKWASYHHLSLKVLAQRPYQFSIFAFDYDIEAITPLLLELKPTYGVLA